MAEARAVKFCISGDYIKSCQRDNKSLLKGAWFGSRDPFLHAQLWTLKKFRHGTPLTKINNVVGDGSASLTYGAADTIRLKLHRFDILCIC